MHGNHFLHAFWLLPFLLSANINISVNALPQAQSDFNIIIVPLNNNHDGRPTGTLGQDGRDSNFIIPKEAYYPILLNEQLLRPEPPPLRGDVAVVDVVVANNNNQNCRSLSSNNNNYSQSSLVRKREVLACPPVKPNPSPDPTPEPTPKSTPKSTPDSTPELIAPHMTTFQESDDDKCPPNLMGMSRIPVCDSGRPGEDSMRLAGFDYYTLFKITPDEGSGCITPSWPWCCASIGKQRHPLWLDRDDVETGYICKDKDREEWYAKYPDPEGPSFDGGKDLELGWKKRKAKRALHNLLK